MAMDILEIKAKYDNGDYSYKVNIPKKVKPDHVFDEELSVKRNRELVIEHNDDIDKMWRNRTEKQNELNTQFTNDVVDYIMAYYSLTEKQARILENFVYQEYHSCMYDYFSKIDTLADLAFQLLPVNSEDT